MTSAALPLVLGAGALLTWPAGRTRGRSRRPRAPSPRRAPPVLAVALAPAVGLLAAGVPGLLAGVLIAPLVLAAGRRWAARRAGARAEPDLPLLLDLAAAALRAGRPPESAIALAAAEVGGAAAADLARVAALLGLGAAPAEAWGSVAARPGLGPLARRAARSADSGVRLAETFEAVASDVRAQARLDGLTRANRVGVLAIAPLGLCFLPAFVCLGVLPVVLGIAKEVAGGLG